MIIDKTAITTSSKPFLKWAGGKTQLIPAIEKVFPYEVFKKDDITYVEPFVGGGAVVLWFLRNFPHARRVVINDLNTDLINAYIVIKEKTLSLIQLLAELERKYKSLPVENQKLFFLEKRKDFNEKELDTVEKTSLLIFLNRTCFNGLYRVNSRNKFNVPFGDNRNPTICDRKNLMNLSFMLRHVKILNVDFEMIHEFIDGKAFFYFDPPYRPLNKTSSFNSYTSGTFNDIQQSRLAHYCHKLHHQNHLWLLSNSDPRNTDSSDNFIDELYNEFSISRISANRRINSDPGKRGELTEVLIKNY